MKIYLNMEHNFKNILDYLDKEDIEDILEYYEFPKSGKKEKLIEIILKNATLFESAISKLLNESYKDDIQEMCDDLGIDSDGNKEKLLQRIIDYIFKIKIKKDIQNNPTKKTIQSIKNNDEITEKQSSSPKRRGWTDMQKEDVRERQDGRCNECNKHPPRWEYHHIDCDSSNNRLDNCEALCPNCHSIKTHENDR